MAVAVLVGVEAGLTEEEAVVDALCVAEGVDGVQGELCSCLTKAAASGSLGNCSLRSMCGLTSEFPSSSRNILRLAFLVEFHPWWMWVHNINALHADTSRML